MQLKEQDSHKKFIASVRGKLLAVRAIVCFTSENVRALKAQNSYQKATIGNCLLWMYQLVEFLYILCMRLLSIWDVEKIFQAHTSSFSPFGHRKMSIYSFSTSFSLESHGDILVLLKHRKKSDVWSKLTARPKSICFSFCLLKRVLSTGFSRQSLWKVKFHRFPSRMAEKPCTLSISSKTILLLFYLLLITLYLSPIESFCVHLSQNGFWNKCI